jgi:hypothetical protein
MDNDDNDIEEEQQDYILGKLKWAITLMFGRERDVFCMRLRCNTFPPLHLLRQKRTMKSLLLLSAKVVAEKYSILIGHGRRFLPKHLLYEVDREREVSLDSLIVDSVPEEPFTNYKSSARYTPTAKSSSDR